MEQGCFFASLSEFQCKLLGDELRKQRSRLERNQARVTTQIVLGPLPEETRANRNRSNLIKILSGLSRFEGEKPYKSIYIDKHDDEWAIVSFNTASDATYARTQLIRKRIFQIVNFYSTQEEEEGKEEKGGDGFFSSMSMQQVREWSLALKFTREYGSDDTKTCKLVVGLLPTFSSVGDARSHVIDVLSESFDHPPTRHIYVSPGNLKEAELEFFTIKEKEDAQAMFLEKKLFEYAHEK